MDADTDDITANGFGNCLTRDGQGGPSANLPMGNFRHTGVGSGVARTDYAALGQVQDGTPQWAIAGGTADAITATYTPAITALIDGQICWFRAAASNATTTPTFAPNGLTARTITKGGGQALGVADISGSLAECVLRYDLANTRWELLNPATPAPSVGRVMPTGTIIPYAGSSAPAGFILCGGQAVSRTTFAALFAIIGTTYGTGDGSTTFNVPDLRGRAVFGVDNMGGSAANRITVAGGNFDGTALGGAGGAQNRTLAQSALPNATLGAGSLSITQQTYSRFQPGGEFLIEGISASTAGAPPGGFTSLTPAASTQNTAGGNAVSGATASMNGGVGQTAVPTIDPALMLNYLIAT